MQLVRIGQLYLAAVPAEFTITSGYRLRRTVATELGVPVENVILSGYANAYSGYVTTPEEYDQQDYEGGVDPLRQVDASRVPTAVRGPGRGDARRPHGPGRRRDAA